MKSLPPALLGLVHLAAIASADDVPKTLSPVRIDPDLLHTEPYRFNGAVLTSDGHYRGSGFVAWNVRTFFSAAHLVYNDAPLEGEIAGWGAPPYWYPTINQEELDGATRIQTRGYYRWKAYADLVPDGTRKSFSKDAILAFAFENLIPGTPAALDLKAVTNLKAKAARTTMITGYPGDNLYQDEELTGYYLYQTGPALTPYVFSFGKSMATTLITTGHGNSGGPLWIQDNSGAWKAGGVLVGGAPSESVVYAFSADVNSLTRAVSPLVKTDRVTNPHRVSGIGATSFFYPMNKAKKIPDGVQRWTNFIFKVGSFEYGTGVTKVKLSLDITTPHQGDLYIILQGPGGVYVTVHNEEGGGTDDLVLKDLDLSTAFAGIDPKGQWFLRVQDRLKGDIATVNNALLEIGVDGEPPETP